MTHICVGNLTIIGSDNDLTPTRRQDIDWTNAGILLIGPLGTIFNEILGKFLAFSFKKKRLNVSSAKWRPFCLGLVKQDIICEFDIMDEEFVCIQLFYVYTFYRSIVSGKILDIPLC